MMSSVVAWGGLEPPKPKRLIYSQVPLPLGYHALVAPEGLEPTLTGS